MNVETGGRQGRAPAMPGPKRERELRLDFFRGLAMFIILLAHIPNNTWTLWIPARFGFSDATEIFVFCSGFASALAFGTVFARAGWLKGMARILFRVWQVYWAHVGVFLVTAALVFAIDHFGLGTQDFRYVERPYVVPFFDDTGEALLGLLTLTYVPGLFDILPMYLVILALIPAVVAARTFGGVPAAAALVVGLWLLASLGGAAWQAQHAAEPGALLRVLGALGEPFMFLNLSASPFSDAPWFFNPFAWQIVFFTGFAFASGWLPAPPVSRRLVLLALAVVVVSLPFSWHKLHDPYGYIPDGASAVLQEVRRATEPLWWKSWQGAVRFVHFLAVAYLAWVAVGPGGERLRTGFPTPPAPSRLTVRIAAAVVVLTVPYAYVEEIKSLAPALDAWLMRTVPIVPDRYMGLVQIAHLVALVLIVWRAIGPERRAFATTGLFLRALPVIRKVGTQSLAVFIVSIPLSVACGWMIDTAGPDVWTRAAVNLFGISVLVAVAYGAAWFKSEPWREKAAPARHAPSPDYLAPDAGTAETAAGRRGMGRA